MKKIAQVCIGVDISKDTLDVYIHPTGLCFKIANSEKAIQKLIKGLNQKELVQTPQEQVNPMIISDPHASTSQTSSSSTPSRKGKEKLVTGADLMDTSGEKRSRTDKAFKKRKRRKK